VAFQEVFSGHRHYVMSSGRAVQVFGPATGKAWLPMVDCLMTAKHKCRHLAIKDTVAVVRITIYLLTVFSVVNFSLVLDYNCDSFSFFVLSQYYYDFVSYFILIYNQKNRKTDVYRYIGYVFLFILGCL